MLEQHYRVVGEFILTGQDPVSFGGRGRRQAAVRCQGEDKKKEWDQSVHFFPPAGLAFYRNFELNNQGGSASVFPRDNL